MTSVLLYVVIGSLLALSGIAKGYMDNIARGIWNKKWWNKQLSWRMKYNMHWPRYLYPLLWVKLYAYFGSRDSVVFLITMVVSIGSWILVIKGEIAGHSWIAQTLLIITITAIPIMWYIKFISQVHYPRKQIPHWITSTFLVFLSDGWHFFQMLSNSAWQLALAIIICVHADIKIQLFFAFIIIKSVVNVAFTITYWLSSRINL